VGIDEERSAAKAYGVYALLGLDSVHIARPATFVVDRQGIVRQRFVATFQWQKMPLQQIEEALREIG
jgi:peroxiredoxin